MRLFALSFALLFIVISWIAVVAADVDCSTVPGVGEPCGLTNVGTCRIGSMACDPASGALVCRDAVNPTVDEDIIPDGRDENCDGVPDQNSLKQCTTSSQCGQSTYCLDVQCFAGYCKYTARNAGRACPSNASACLAPFQCTARGQCLSISAASCSSYPSKVDPRQSYTCIVVKCVQNNCMALPWYGACDDGDVCTTNDTCSIDSRTKRPVCRGVPVGNATQCELAVRSASLSTSTPTTTTPTIRAASASTDDAPKGQLVYLLVAGGVAVAMLLVGAVILICMAVDGKNINKKPPKPRLKKTLRNKKQQQQQ